MTEKPYHHGDLRQALLTAAEAELATHGIEAFSLRQVAKRAGVSHAAPAHHFGDGRGLLTAMAAEGYRLFLRAQAAREAVADLDGRSQMVAAGLGYLDFAMQRPALFRLMFGSSRPDYGDPDLKAAANAAYAHLTDQVMRAGGHGMEDVAALWSAAHGLADLISAGRMKGFDGLDAVARDGLVAAVLRRALP